MSALRIPSAGRDLAARLFAPASPSGAAVVFIHGWRSTQEAYAARAQPLVDRLGITCITFDLGGHGRSTGDLANLAAEDHVADAAAAYDCLAAAAGVDPGRIGVCGASYGANIAVRLSAVRAVQRLVLRAPALPEDRAGLDELRAFTGPTLVVESSGTRSSARRRSGLTWLRRAGRSTAPSMRRTPCRHRRRMPPLSPCCWNGSPISDRRDWSVTVRRPVLRCTR